MRVAEPKRAIDRRPETTGQPFEDFRKSASDPIGEQSPEGAFGGSPSEAYRQVAHTASKVWPRRNVRRQYLVQELAGDWR